MVIMIMTLFLFGLAYRAVRAARLPPSHTASSNPVLTRLFNAEDDRPVSAAECREADLSRQLLNGQLDSHAYQLAMTDLVQPDASRPEHAR